MRRPPFTGPTREAVLAQHAAAAPVPPSELVDGLPPALERLVLRLLAKPRPSGPPRPPRCATSSTALRAPGPWAARRGASRSSAAGASSRSPRRPRAPPPPGGCRSSPCPASRGWGRRGSPPRSRPPAATGGALAVWGRGVEDAGAYAPWRAVLRVLAARSDLPPPCSRSVRRLTGDGRGGAAASRGEEEDRTRLFDAVAATLTSAAAPAGARGRARRPAARRPLVARAAAARRARPRPARACCSSSPTARARAADHGLPEALADLGRTPGFARLRLAGLALEGDVAPLRPARAPACATRSCATCTSARAATRSTSPSSPARSRARRRSPATARSAARARPSARSSSSGCARCPSQPPRARRRRRARPPVHVVAVARIARPRARRGAGGARARARRRLVTEVPRRPAGSPSRTRSCARPSTTRWRPPGAARCTPPSSTCCARARTGAPRCPSPRSRTTRSSPRARARTRRPRTSCRSRRPRRPSAVLAHAEAAGHYADALEALDELGAEATSRPGGAAALGLAGGGVAAGEIGTGRRHYRAAAADARRRGARRGAGPRRARVRRVPPLRRDRPRGDRVLEQALAALPPDDSAERARVAARLAVRLDPRRAARGARRSPTRASRWRAGSATPPR